MSEHAAGWPIVALNDSGIRPAGPPDECFYCQARVGQPHGEKCGVVTKLIRARYIIDVDLRVPYSWDKDRFEFHRNDGTWCANNAVNEIEAHIQAEPINDVSSVGTCLCHRFKAEFVSVLDATPTRDLNTPQQVSLSEAIRKQLK